jgi:hypothetical protein
MVQDRDQRQVLVKMIINIQVPCREICGAKISVYLNITRKVKLCLN